MTKFPFSDAGFQSMQTKCYALNDVELAAIANSIYNQFLVWLEDSFELTESQISFMQNLGPQMIDLLAAQTSLAFGNRLPITLNKEELQANTLLRGSKLIRPKLTTTATATGSNNFQVTGTLEIEITY